MSLNDRSHSLRGENFMNWRRGYLGFPNLIYHVLPCLWIILPGATVQAIVLIRHEWQAQRWCSCTPPANIKFMFHLWLTFYAQLVTCTWTGLRQQPNAKLSKQAMLQTLHSTIISLQRWEMITVPIYSPRCGWLFLQLVKSWMLASKNGNLHDERDHQAALFAGK